MRRISPHGRGNLAMLAAMALFVVNDSLVKLALASCTPSQVLAVRGLFATAFIFALVVALGQASSLKAMFTPRVMLRAVLEGLVAFTFISALARLPIANITAILQASSLIIIAFAAVLGLERIGWRRATAVLVGFAGVLCVVQPSSNGFNAFSLLALVSAVLVALRDLITRGISATVPSGVVAFGTTLAVTLSGFAFGLAETWPPLHSRSVALLMGAALAVGLGNVCIIIAYRDGEISLVSGLRYAVLVFALLAGFLVWGELPDALAVIGSVLIVCSGLYALHRQQTRQRQAIPGPADAAPLATGSLATASLATGSLATGSLATGTREAGVARSLP
jgi:drug/metabolite transporter (DMT)-like permease